MTKSAVNLAQAALTVGSASLPAYANKYSRHDFTQPQLFAILVLRHFLKTDYRGVVTLLGEWSELRRALKLKKVPNYSTLWHVEQKLIKKGLSPACSPLVSPEPGESD